MKQAQKHIVLLNDKTIIELDFAKYRDLSVSRRSIICLCLRHRQIIDLLATDKSRYFAQPRPIIVYWRRMAGMEVSGLQLDRIGLFFFFFFLSSSLVSWENRSPF